MKHLLTGASGTLGIELQKSNLIEYYPARRSWMNVADEDAMYFAYDCVNKDFDRGILNGIVHCAAYTDVPGAEKNRAEVVETNIMGTKRIAEWGKLFNVPVVYISTDYVYPGEGVISGYKETDLTRPVNFYAFTKLAGEAYLDLEKDLIIRSFKPNGKWPYPEAFDDLYTSADYVDTITWKIEFLIKNKATGIYNVGTERKTIYDLARCRTPSVKPISKNSIRGVILPDDVSMNFDKYNQFYDSVNL